MSSTTNTTFACRLAAVSLVVLAVSATSCMDRDARKQTVWHGKTMGTTYTVKVITDGRPPDKNAIGSALKRSLAAVNKQMSTYDPDSELSRWNTSQSTDWFEVSADTAAVVAEAVRIGRLSRGAFDVTVDPLVRLWNFGPADSKNASADGKVSKQTNKIPDDEKIEDALRRVGYSKIESRSNPPAVRKQIAEMHVDLSGIAKGYAVDRLARLLESRGFHDYMVEVGGEIRTAGHNLAGVGWQIAVEAPVAGRRKIDFVIPLENRAMATSGDYRNYFEKDSVRYSHLIDPRTGRPIRHRLASVTVLSDTCAEADAFATGLMVLGPDEGYKLAESLGLAAAFIVKTDVGFEQKRTSNWPGAKDR